MRDATDEQLAYISDLSSELRELAKALHHSGRHFLAFLLDMAAKEAERMRRSPARLP